MFNREPHSYTRFNLTQNMEGDNSQVEMKLSSNEEVKGSGVGRKPYVAQKLGRTPKNLCFMAATTLLIFIIGKRAADFLFGLHNSEITSSGINLGTTTF